MTAEILIEISDTIIQTIIGLLIALALIVIGWNINKKHRSLKANGLRADGIIFSVEPETSYRFTINLGGAGSRVGTYYYPVIRFLTAELEWITKKYDVGRQYGYYKEGTDVKVIYDPKDPENFVLDNWFFRLNVGLLIVALGLIFLVALIIFMLMLYGAGISF